MYRSLTLVSSLLLATGSAQAFERQHDSHEHGVATMLVALEGKELQLVLENPAANFAGFEHAPRNEEQRQVLERVEKQLQVAETVLALPAAAGCQVEHMDLKHSLDSEGGEAHNGHDHDEHHGEEHKGHDHDEHHDEDHKGHDHDEHHDEEHNGHDHDEHHDEEHKGHDHDEHHHDEEHKGHDHDEHHDEAHKGHDHDGHHGDESSHSDYRLEYHFECSNPAALKEIEVNLFRHFSLLHDLDVNYIGPNGQGAAELNPENPRFRF